MKTMTVLTNVGKREFSLCDNCNEANWRYYCYREVARWRFLALMTLTALGVVTTYLVLMIMGIV
jgi:hypothetical protein